MLNTILFPVPIYTVALVLIGALAVSCIMIWPKFKAANFVLKPMATLSIIAIAYELKATGIDDAYSQWVIIALWFALGGDICLMFQRTSAFIAGIVFFLIGHLFFMKAFMIDFTWSPILMIVTLAVIVYLYKILSSLWPKLDNFKIPVILYAIIISAMTFFAFSTLVNPHFSSIKAGIIVFSACLFLLSDTLIAWNKFIGATPQPFLSILLTYYIAIYLFTTSTGII